MSQISHYGDPKCPIWCVITEPYKNDAEQGYLFSGGYGFNHKKLWKAANLPDSHIRSIKPTLGATYDTNMALSKFLVEIEVYKPKIIVPLDDLLLNYLCPDTKQIKEKNSSLRKWAGSLLKSPFIQHEHYIVGCFDPEWITRNWDQSEIQTFIYFGHVREEYEFFVKNGFLQQPPQRNLITEPAYDVLFDYLNNLLDGYRNNGLPYISVDIETIRPKNKSFYQAYGHPGYSYTIAIAPSSKEAISFSLFDYGDMMKGGSLDKGIAIWRKLDEVLNTIPQIYQNGFIFDSNHLESLGNRICLERCQDTMLRHHVLWPELPHKLQFQTIQYTREPYYKDEGKHWSSKYKKQLMVYNAKDAAVTFEIFEEQEKEFQQKPHLR